MPHESRSPRHWLLCALVVAFAAAATAPAGTAGSHRVHHELVRILVKAKPQAGHALERQLAALGVQKGHSLPQLHVQVLRVRRTKAAAIVARLSRLAGVEFAERNRVVMRVVSTNLVQSTPTDPLWSQQWGPALAAAPTAWAVSRGASTVVVAVLDTGVDPSQPDLQGAVVPGYDFVNKDADPMDDQGHGTSVAGVIAARADNGLGGAGLCPRCSIMPVKVAAADGTASELNVASGIIWAADHGARVVNLSLGGTFGATVRDAVDYAAAKGVVVVAAAGNNGNSNLFYPAADDGVLSVAASQSDDRLYSWSNYGSWVAVAAPGCDLATQWGGSFGDFCGTSASTPFVAGLAGLAWSYAPNVSADTIKSAITSSAHPIAGVVYGRVDVAGTLAALGATFAPAPAPPASPPPPTASVGPPAAPVSAGMGSASSSAATHAVVSRKHSARRSRVRRYRAGKLLRTLRVEPFGKAR
jgi:subtilisin family serine protease